MLRVNLLPGYVAQRRLTNQLKVIFTTVFISVVAGLSLFAFIFLLPIRQRVENEAANAKELKQQTDNAKSSAASVRSAVAPIEAKLKYVDAVRDYNKEYPRLFDTMARYTDSKMIYTDATVSGTSLSIKAYAPSIAEVGRYLEAIYKEPDFQTVSIDKLPGYPEAVVSKYYLDGRLVGIGVPPVALPGLPGAHAGGGAQSAGYSGSGSSSSYGGSGGSDSSRYGGGAGGGGTTVNIDPSNLTGERVASLSQVLADRINPIGSPGQISREYIRAISRIRVKQEPKGFGVTITAILKKPLSPPALPGAGGAASPSSSAGGFGGPSSSPGGNIERPTPAGPGGPPSGGPPSGR